MMQGDDASRRTEQLADEARRAETSARDGIERLARQARESGGAVRERAVEYTGRAGQQLTRAGDRFGEFFSEHPLMVGALGFLAGAAIALLLPRSGMEQELLGERGERLREQAVRMGRDAMDRAGAMATRAIDDAATAAQAAMTAGATRGEDEHAKEHIAAGMSEAGGRGGAP